MKLTPHEILKRLGFDVPADGVDINPDDAFLVRETLRLAGATLDVGRISDDDLRGLHYGMAGLVRLWSTSGLIAPLAVPADEPAADSLLKLRSTLRLLLSDMFKRR